MIKPRHARFASYFQVRKEGHNWVVRENGHPVMWCSTWQTAMYRATGDKSYLSWWGIEWE